LINFVNGASPATLFVPRIVATEEPHGARIAAEGSLTFTNWIPFKKRLESLRDAQVVVDLSQVRLIDHTFMDKLVQTQREFTNTGRTLSLAGLEGHHAFGHEATSGRKKALV
jgi:MFS superfamily sulfate permease-like transporter